MLERRKREYQAIQPNAPAVTGKIRCQIRSESGKAAFSEYMPPAGNKGSPVNGFSSQT